MKHDWTKPIIFKDADTDWILSINGKSIFYYEDADKPAYTFMFYTNKESKRELSFGILASPGWWESYIHVDDINK